MSVIVRGMEMPKNCKECDFCKEINSKGYLWFDHYCSAKDKSFDLDEDDNKPDWCPLTEIKEPHGRLIDATFEENHYASMLLDQTPDVTEQDKHKARIIIEALRMAGTVIEAEGREE